MKTKLIGLCVCMLMIATAVPAVTSIKNNSINATIPSHLQTSMASFWNQRQKLLAADGAANDIFGLPVSLSDETVLIGANQDNDNGHWSGSAYVFTRTGTTWTQQAKLLASDGAAEDQFGFSVSLSGDTALIGSFWDNDNGNHSGSAYVFTRTGTTWTQQAKLLAIDGTSGDQFGQYVSLNGDTALIGARFDDDNGVDSGSAYVFTRTGTTWTQQAKLLASDGAAYDDFGHSVSLDNNTALIGAQEYVSNGNGSAYVFTRTGTTWTQQAKLLALDGTANDQFGQYVSLNDDTALVGAPCDDDHGVDSGSAYVFTRTGTTWTQQQKLLASDGAAGDVFSSWAISLDGDTAIIGALYDDNDNGVDSGSAYVFTRTGTSWTQQQKLLASDGAARDYFGNSVSLAGGTAFIGAYGDDDSGSMSGSAYVFTKTSLTYSITGGLGVNLKITNSGTVNASGFPWQIHVQGGILGRINKTANGTIDIPAGGTKTVGTGMLFGFGSLAIAATVAGEDKTATGKQLIIYSILKK